MDNVHSKREEVPDKVPCHVRLWQHEGKGAVERTMLVMQLGCGADAVKDHRFMRNPDAHMYLIPGYLNLPRHKPW